MALNLGLRQVQQPEVDVLRSGPGPPCLAEVGRPAALAALWHRQAAWAEPGPGSGPGPAHRSSSSFCRARLPREFRSLRRASFCHHLHPSVTRVQMVASSWCLAPARCNIDSPSGSCTAVLGCNSRAARRRCDYAATKQSGRNRTKEFRLATTEGGSAKTQDLSQKTTNCTPFRLSPAAIATWPCRPAARRGRTARSGHLQQMSPVIGSPSPAREAPGAPFLLSIDGKTMGFGLSMFATKVPFTGLRMERMAPPNSKSSSATQKNA